MNPGGTGGGMEGGRGGGVGAVGIDIFLSRITKFQESGDISFSGHNLCIPLIHLSAYYPPKQYGGQPGCT
jgi:hypothetical protein